MFAQSGWNGIVQHVGQIVEGAINPINGGVQYLAGNTQISSSAEFLFQRKVVSFKFGPGISPGDGFRNDAAVVLNKTRHLRRLDLVALVQTRAGQRAGVSETE